MKTIRVLQITDMISENSGVSAVIMNYYEHINKERIQFDFMVNEEMDADIQRELEVNGSRVYKMPELYGKNMPHYKQELRKFFEEHKEEYQIIHGHTPNAAVFYMTEAKRAGIPIRILHSHNSRGADGIYKKIRNYVLNHMGVGYANQYMACSKEAAEYLFGKRKNVTLLPNAIDGKKYQYNLAVREEMRKQYGIDNQLVIGHVGRFAEQKNHKFMVEIARKLAETRQDFRMLFVGDGILRQETEEKVKELGLEEYFLFAGSTRQVERYFQMMDVFVLPSLYEGLPVVGVEAQAAGLPCLFSDKVTRDVDFTDCCKFISLQSIDKWSKIINKYRVRSINNNKLVKMKKREIDIKEVVEKLECIYINLLDG